MYDIVLEIIKAFSSQGLNGLILFLLLLCFATIFIMYDVYFRLKVTSLKQRLIEASVDRETLFKLVENNTVAITRNTAAVERCTFTVSQNSRMTQHWLERIENLYKPIRYTKEG